MDFKYCLIKTNLQIRKLPTYGCFFAFFRLGISDERI